MDSSSAVAWPPRPLHPPGAAEDRTSARPSRVARRGRAGALPEAARCLHGPGPAPSASARGLTGSAPAVREASADFLDAAPAVRQEESSGARRPDERFATAAVVSARDSFGAEQWRKFPATASHRSGRPPPLLQPWQSESQCQGILGRRRRPRCVCTGCCATTARRFWVRSAGQLELRAHLCFDLRASRDIASTTAIVTAGSRRMRKS